MSPLPAQKWQLQSPLVHRPQVPRIPVPCRIPATPDSGSYPAFRCLPRIPAPTPDRFLPARNGSYLPAVTRVPVPTCHGFRFLPRIAVSILVPSLDYSSAYLPRNAHPNSSSFRDLVRFLRPGFRRPTPDSGSYPTFRFLPGFRFLPRIRIPVSPVPRIPVPTEDSGSYPGFRFLPGLQVLTLFRFVSCI